MSITLKEMIPKEEDDMANVRRGLTYFPFDVDFYDDLSIRKLIRYKGGKAPQVYALLLCYIYRNGYYAKWDDELPFIISEKLSTDYEEGYINEVIQYCAELGLFDKEMFEKGILTSRSIQKRWLDIQSSLRRKNPIEEYNLVAFSDENVAESGQNVAVWGQNVAVSDENVADCCNSSAKCQRKERKGKEIKENTISNDIVVTTTEIETQKKLTLEERKQVFYQSLIPFLKANGGDYDAEMLRKFFDYWSESSDGGKKMRFEKERDRKNGAFNLKLRLSKWHRNDIEWANERKTSSASKGSSISGALSAIFDNPIPTIPVDEIDVLKIE